MPSRKLTAGDDDYTAYVGPPHQYDFMGATQFRLLCALGLRASHDVLDFGCGSLRAGRFFISYLEPGRYFGIDPNEWLIDEAITEEIGADLVRIKKPRFDHNSDFDTTCFSQQFDFILAQSIFSHAGPDLVARALDSFGVSLRRDGLIAATFIEGENDFAGEGWVYAGDQRHNFYPSSDHGPVTYRQSTIERFGASAGLHTLRLPWYHPRQTWYLFAHETTRLPTADMLGHLSGAVLFDPNFADSWEPSGR